MSVKLEDGRKVEVNDSSMIVAIGKAEEDKAEGEAEAKPAGGSVVSLDSFRKKN